MKFIFYLKRLTLSLNSILSALLRFEMSKTECVYGISIQQNSIFIRSNCSFSFSYVSIQWKCIFCKKKKKKNKTRENSSTQTKKYNEKYFFWFNLLITLSNFAFFALLINLFRYINRMYFLFLCSLCCSVSMFCFSHFRWLENAPDYYGTKNKEIETKISLAGSGNDDVKIFSVA